MFTSALGLAIVVGISLFLARRVWARRMQPLPPGPRGWPLVGNTNISTEYFWTQYSDIGKEYGTIASFTIFGRHFVVLNSRALCVELFEKRSQNYNNRFELEMMSKLVGWSQTTTFLPANEIWKTHRQYFQQSFGTRAAMQQYHDIQVLETRRLMLNLMREPDNLDNHVRYWVAAVILKIIYGYNMKPGKNRLVEIVNVAMAQFDHLLKPGAFLVDSLPFLQFIPSWFPGGGFKTKAKFYRQTLANMLNFPFDVVKEQMARGAASPGFVSRLLNADDYNEGQDDTIKSSAATAYAGGVDTTSAQVHGFFLIMLLWPEKQKKAQEEIDRVIGSDRLPGFRDRGDLPYTEALLTECLRLHTAAPIGGIRCALDDDVVMGFQIPKGSVILPNIWQILHDPETYPDPLDFIPERWLVESPPPSPRDTVFGFGRRICAGMVMADASFYISCVMTLALFDIRATDGSPTAFTHGEGGPLDGHSICHPKPFKCTITPRSAKAEYLIKSIEDELQV